MTPASVCGLYSIGYSNHELAAFVRLLQGAGITALADVRSAPYSRRSPHFNGKALAPVLREAGIVYVFLGDHLGGRPSADELYDDEGRVDYERVRATACFQEGLERLRRGASRYAVAMMCGEADPLDCHRGLMITPALVAQGIHPLHILRDGTLETTAQLEARLLRETGIGSGLVEGLFAPVLNEEDRRELLRQAYRAQARRKAFQREAHK